jgi:hypothetical protein
MPSVMWHYYSTEEDGKNATQIQQLKYWRNDQKNIDMRLLQKANGRLRSLHAAEK